MITRWLNLLGVLLPCLFWTPPTVPRYPPPPEYRYQHPQRPMPEGRQRVIPPPRIPRPSDEEPVDSFRGSDDDTNAVPTNANLLPPIKTDHYGTHSYPDGLGVDMNFSERIDDIWAATLRHARIRPPAEYEHPAAGPVTVRDLTRNENINFECGWPMNAKGLVGCAKQETRTIIIADPELLASFGVTRNQVLRHEIAHLNGWPGDHPGAR